MAQLVALRPDYFDDSGLYKLAVCKMINPEVAPSYDGNFNIKEFLEFKICDVRCKKTKAERDARRRATRKEYMKTPIVMAKIQARAKDPKVLEQKRAYSAKETTKARKSLRSKTDRALKATLKRENPVLYEKLKEKVEHELRSD